MTFGEVEPELSFVAWVVQLLAAFCGPLIVLMIFDTWRSVQDTPGSQILGYLFIGTAGCLLALFVSAVAREAMNEGVWVWVLPALFELIAVTWQAYSGGLSSAFRGFFYIVGSGGGEESLGVVLMTMPTLSCCCYSATMWWRMRGDKAKRTADDLTARF